MIANGTELTVALHNLHILEQGLQALRDQLAASNPDLLAVTAETYTRRIKLLQTEVAGYLYQHPSDVSLITSNFATASVREEPSQLVHG